VHKTPIPAHIASIVDQRVFFVFNARVNASSKPLMGTLDANEAVASVAYRMNEFFAIYPITPSSPMAEFADEWSAAGRKNLWDAVPSVVEMQSEGGAAGALHGALMAGSLSASFTASQGLLLMIPNMYKIAGELSPFCLHVTARALATHALSIFGDHSDVMACRQTGFAMLAGGSVQEAQDTAVISQMVTLRSRVPFLHFFDGFRTSHEVSKIELISDEVLKSLLNEDAISSNRARALTPDNPRIRGTAQNPDAFFQAREGCNTFYQEVPRLVKEAMADFAACTGRAYKPFDYEGHPEADRVVIIMGSGAEAVGETVGFLNETGEKVGVIKVRLYRPFAVEDFASVMPKTVKSIAVLDRTKEPGALGEPLYLDVVGALRQADTAGWMKDTHTIRVIGGRYGLGSKEFTPAMVKAVFDELTKPAPKQVFTVGIKDDVTGLSLDYDPEFEVVPPGMKQAVFFGLGSDGTVGANKNSIKIIGEGTDNYAQGYFVYDSKKAGAMTVSHLRFGPQPIRSTYLIRQAEFVACHRFDLLNQVGVIEYAKPGGIFLLNMRHGLPCHASFKSRSSSRTWISTRSMPARWPATWAWPAASTPSCRLVTSPSPGCCPRMRRSLQSNTPSKRPTANAVTPWCRKTTRPSMAHWKTWSRSTTRMRRPRHTGFHRSFRRMLRILSNASPHS
jgi:pyruvate-ferredoxin/flavodoxin oxidoreductase